jgi:hypothetical protein
MSICKRCDVPLEDYEKFHCDVCEHYNNSQSERIADKMLQSAEMTNLIFGPAIIDGLVKAQQQFNQFDWSK